MDASEKKKEGRWKPEGRLSYGRDLQPHLRSVKGLHWGVTPFLLSTTFKNLLFSKMATVMAMYCLALMPKSIQASAMFSSAKQESTKVSTQLFRSKDLVLDLMESAVRFEAVVKLLPLHMRPGLSILCQNIECFATRILKDASELTMLGRLACK